MRKSKGKKFKLVFDEVWKIISGDLKIGELLPTETALSEKLSVNRLTVAKVLRTLEQEGYVYRKAGMGTRLERKPPTGNNGFIMVIGSGNDSGDRPSDEDESASAVFASIQKTATGVGVPVLWIPCEKGEPDIAKLKLLYNPATTQGIIITNAYTSAQRSLIEYLREIHCPVVWALASPPVEENVNRVDIDNRSASYELVTRLIRQGCRRIACFSIFPDTIARQERLLGYKDALKKKGIEFREELCISIDSPSLEGAGKDCAALFLSRKLQADGLLCVDGRVLNGAQNFWKEYKPELLSSLPAASFDIEPDAKRNLLLGVKQPFEQIGRLAVEMLRKLVDSRSTPVCSQFIKHKITTINQVNTDYPV